MNDTGHHHDTKQATNQSHNGNETLRRVGGAWQKKKYHPKNVGTNAGNEKGRKP